MAAEDWLPPGWEGEIDWYEDEGFSMFGRRKPPRMGTLVAPTIFETERAWKVRIGGKEEWLPKSVCDRESGGMGGDTYSIPQWLADKKGIDQFVDY